MKKVVGLLVILFAAAVLPTASANQDPAIAIIDTAVDTSLVSVSYEVCILEEKRCPNKQAFMEGPGSAHMPASGGFEHGTKMALVAKKINPNAKIIFIRVFSADKTGTRTMPAATNINSTVKQAMDWVLVNKNKFNIVATSVSLTEQNDAVSSKYCKTDTKFTRTITSLQNAGIGTFFSAGNGMNMNSGYKYDRISYPACIPASIAVSSVNADGNNENYANRSTEVDFYTLGTYDLSIGRSMGTSDATVALAAYWTKNYKGNFSSTYDYLKTLSNKFVNVLG